MKHLTIAALLALSTLTLSSAADAQGVPGGMRRGAAEGDRVGGPIGAVIGGAVGGAVGGVNGVLGIDPGRRSYRTNLRSRRGHHSHYRRRHH